MHRRARHLKGTSIGCNLQLDARYLTDSDGTALSSWSDRSSNGYSATQATSTKQPLVRTGANGINGSTALSFDGSNDGLAVSSFVNNSNMYILFAVKLTTASMVFEHGPDANTVDGFYNYGQSSNNIQLRRNTSYYIQGINNWIGSSPAIASFRYYSWGAANYWVNGNEITKVGAAGSVGSLSNVTNSLNIMCRNQSGLFTNGLLGAVIIGSGDLYDPIRNRIQHSLAFSFKIACS